MMYKLRSDIWNYYCDLKDWIQDKIGWLKTFNNKPTIRIVADKIYSTKNQPVVYCEGRADVMLEVDTMELDNRLDVIEKELLINK